MSAIELSLIVCTRDRADRLARTLAHVAALQGERAWELVVVDNGSRDRTPEMLREFARTCPHPLTLVHEPRPGLGRARNAGLRASAGALVAFVDDDCYPAADFLARVRACFAENAHWGYLGGRILLFDPADLPMTIQESLIPREIKPRSFVPTGLIQGANIAFRRVALEAVGGFDARLGAGTPFPCEDVDAVARLSAAGWMGAYDPRPVVYHHHGRRTRTERERLLRAYDHGAGAYYVKCLLHPALRWPCVRHGVKACLKVMRAGFHRSYGAIRFLLRPGGGGGSRLDEPARPAPGFVGSAPAPVGAAALCRAGDAVGVERNREAAG